MFQISDQRAELWDVIPSVLTFENPADLELLIRDMLTLPEARSHSADRAREQVQGHTFADRAAILTNALAAWELHPTTNGHRAREEVATV